MNLCIFKGRLTAKPTAVKTSNDVSVVNFTLAVEQGRQDKQTGEYKSYTQFLDFEIWDSGAEVFAKRFDKGDLVLVESSARVNKWKDKETEKEQRAIRFRVDKFDGLSKNVTSKNSQKEETVPSGAGAQEDTVPF